MADAHDHAVENIPDGSATSPEPIVRLLCFLPTHFIATLDLSNFFRLHLGLDIMGPHLHQYAGLWPALSPRHGSRRESFPPLLACRTIVDGRE